MPTPDDADRRIVAAAASAALGEARWQSQDLLSRRSPDSAPDLLRGHAAELAFSPVGRDQVLGLALSAVAAQLERGATAGAQTPLAVLDGPDPSESGRLVLRSEVFRSGPLPSSESRKVAQALERRHRPDCRSRLDLASRLREDAALHKLLWDDTRLACDSRTRLVMLFAIPKLLERADQLDPGGASQPDEAPRRPAIRIGVTDHRRLQRLALETLLSNPRVAGPLLAELDRAEVVADQALPPDVVRLDSWITYSDPQEDQPTRARLVCEAGDAGPGTLPVLTPTGAALIGLSVGQSILWADHLGGDRWITVTDVGPAQEAAP